MSPFLSKLDILFKKWSTSRTCLINTLNNNLIKEENHPTFQNSFMVWIFIALIAAKPLPGECLGINFWKNLAIPRFIPSQGFTNSGPFAHNLDLQIARFWDPRVKSWPVQPCHSGPRIWTSNDRTRIWCEIWFRTG